jgi:YidC/Oxa1 family membrane protein insertase
MNQTRSFLLIAWLAVAALLWIEWNKPAAAPAAPTNAVAATPDAAGTHAAGTNALASVGALPGAPSNANGAAPLAAAPLASGAQASATGAADATIAPSLITLESDTLRLQVDLAGGRITDSQLLQYTVEKKPGSPHVELLSSGNADWFVADAGLISVDAHAVQRDLQPRFHTASGANAFRIADGAGELAVPLSWTDPQTGVSLTRTLRLKRGSYVLEVDDTLANQGSTAQRLYPVVGLSRVAPPPPPKHSFLTNPDSLSFVGGVWYSPDAKYTKVAFKDFTAEPPGNASVTGGWIGMLQHHFASAWVPMENDAQTRFETSIGTHGGMPLYNIRSIAAPIDLAPGAQATHGNRLWVGPKLQGPMAEVSPELRRTVDYGRLTFIAQPLFWLLSALHRLLGNWGWAIIAIVLLLKAALYPLSRKQYQSMAKMRSVQPRMEALRERYGDDKQALNLAMMELYKKEKINPIGGCLPILVQMPVFFALYWVLLETVELRHAPWMGWIQNLTAPDPYFILPALNLLVMFLTQRMTPTPGMDPMQKRMMQFMPLVFGTMMLFFPAGLVLYWVTNGSLGLLQQWWMTRVHGPNARPPSGKSPATVSR